MRRLVRQRSQQVGFPSSCLNFLVTDNMTIATEDLFRFHGIRLTDLALDDKFHKGQIPNQRPFQMSKQSLRDIQIAAAEKNLVALRQAWSTVIFDGNAGSREAVKAIDFMATWCTEDQLKKSADCRRHLAFDIASSFKQQEKRWAGYEAEKVQMGDFSNVFWHTWIVKYNLHNGLWAAIGGEEEEEEEEVKVEEMGGDLA